MYANKQSESNKVAVQTYMFVYPLRVMLSKTRKLKAVVLLTTLNSVAKG